MSTADFARKVFTMIAESQRRRMHSLDYEMAYQARVASDRIRFAIRVLEKTGTDDAEIRQAGLELLDALDRLESAEHHFQSAFRHLVENQPGREVQA